MQYTVKLKQNLHSLQILITRNGLFQSLRLDKFTVKKRVRVIIVYIFISLCCLQVKVKLPYLLSSLLGTFSLPMTKSPKNEDSFQ